MSVMTRKQIRKLAEQITKLELIHRNPDSSKEEKTQAESQIIQLSCMFEQVPGGIEAMFEVDELVQKNIAEYEKKKGE